MKVMRLTFKYRLNPTKAQRTALQATLDACRWVYNKTLEVRKTALEKRKESVSYYDTKRMLPEWKADHPFLKQAYSQTLQEMVKRLDLAFQHFFRRVQAGEKEAGYPRFKGKGWYDSFTFPQCEFGWKLEAERLHLYKIGAVKIKLHRPLEGEIKTRTIRRDTLGNWYACFSVELTPILHSPSEWPVGIDMGLQKFATLSTGEMIANPRFFRKDEKALAKAQRKRDKLPKGSRERCKASRVVQHIHARIANRRKDFAHKVSRYLVNTFGFIAFEDLNTKGMMQNHCLAKSIGDAAWNQLIQYTTYKAASADRMVVMVDPRYTSQDCSGCGHRVKKALKERVHRCGACGVEIDRDVNAALNILARGLAGVGESP
jgi:putative transposase